MADEKDSWKDTNVGLIGSDLDKAVRKEAAAHEPAWATAGQKAGLLVWRIEHFQVVAVEAGSYGQFYKGDSYICLQTIEDPESSKLSHNIYFYLGCETSIDEQGTAAYKTVELDDFLDGEPTQHREVMNEESEAFKALFGGTLTLLDGGIDSGFKHVVPEGHDPKLWQVRKVKGQMTSQRVPLETRVLHKDDSYVLDGPDAIYVFDGPTAEPTEKLEANRKAEHLESEREGKVQATHEIDDAFWALLKGAKPAYCAPKPAAAAPAPVPAKPAGSYSLEELQNGCPAGVSADEKEQALSDAEFKEVLGQSKEDFAKLPKWKQHQAKKEHRLF